MNRYIEDIKKATCVEANYCKWIDLYYEKNYPNDEAKWERMKESVFSYEFYKNFRENMKKNSERYEGLCFHAEITKRLSDDGNGIYYPDFVLHGGQHEMDNNLIAIEIKTKDRIPNNNTKEGQKNLLEDIKALIAYVEELKYEIGLFICVNKTTSDLRKNVEHVYNLNKDGDLKRTNETLNKICFIGTVSEDKEIEDFTLSECSDV